jgi:hypothetical protein
MDGYLVILMGDLDDIPVMLFDQRDESEAFGIELHDHYDGEPDEGPDHHPAVSRSLDLMGRDMGTYQGVAVAGFRGGEMTSWELIGDGGDE